MVSWFSRDKAPKATESNDRLHVPGGLWTKCSSCSAILYRQELERNLSVCPKCFFHFRINASERIQQLADVNSFQEMHAGLVSGDPLNFRDSVRYKDRLKKAQKKASSSDAVRVGKAELDGIGIMLAAFDFDFMGGSMGIVVGEKLTSMIEVAVSERRPVVIVSASGGARMQEGIFSLMQMARITSALARLGEKGVPYISVLTDPTTGGVAASFAMLGDLNIAEPGALIGFAGPRVIEQTIKKQLPEGFQRAEFLLAHGMLDQVVKRCELKQTLARALRILCRQSNVGHHVFRR